MWSLLWKPLYIPMRRRKMYFLVHKLIRNRSSWGPCQFWFLSSNTLWKTYLSICLETWKNLNGKHLEKWRICMEMWRILKKWKIRNNDEFDWKNWRICMEKYWNVKNVHGNVKDFQRKMKNIWKNDEFVSKVKEFIWSNGILNIGSLTSTVF